jgi:two-component system, cell cycle sensor histidine kinase and response regulator CckA
MPRGHVHQPGSRSWRLESLSPQDIEKMPSDDVQNLISDLRVYEEELQAQNEELRRVQEDIVRAKEEWERTFNAVPDLVAVLDRDYRIVRVNQAMARRLGMSPEQCVGLHCYEAVHETSKPPGPCPHYLTCTDCQQHVVEVYEPRLGGHCLVSTTPIFDARGEVVGIVHIARDINEQKQAEESLRRSEQRLILAQRAGGVGVFDWDLASGRIFWTEQLEELFGLVPGQFEGTSEGWGRRLVPEDRRRLRRLMVQWMREHRQEVEYDYRMIRADGDIRWISARARYAYGPDGHAVRMIGTNVDITERRSANNALRDSEARLRGIFEAVPDAVFIKDRELRYTFVNPAMERLIGRPPSQAIGRTDPELYPPDVAAGIRDEDVHVLAGETLERERIMPVSGSPHTFHVIKVPLWDGTGTVIGVCGTSRDVTELKRAEEERRRLEAQLQHAQKVESLGILAGGIAHDFNNLLVGILGNASMALEDLPPGSPQRENLSLIEEAATRAAKLTNQMLAYSGRGAFVVGPIDLSERVRESLRLLRHGVSRRIALVPELADELPVTEGDVSQIDQVIINLVTNAAEAIGESGGTITLRTKLVHESPGGPTRTPLGEPLPEGDYVCLEVVDTGCGMDAGALGKIFDPFFTTKFTGRGLGLAAVLGIVRGHYGTIHVESTPGKGSTFMILFPAKGPAVHRPPMTEDSPPRQPAAGETVLVVDDEEQVRMLSKMALERAGYRVLTAVDGREGVETFRRHAGEIAAVLLDLTTPGLSGVEAFDAIRQIRPDARVVLSSGYSREDATRGFSGRTLCGFLQKPYKPASLVATIRDTVKRENEG